MVRNDEEGLLVQIVAEMSDSPHNCPKLSIIRRPSFQP